METVKLMGQHYRSLRTALMGRRQKFEDPEFPPDECGEPVWSRPSDLVHKPRLISDGVSGADVLAGDRGCDWFVTACSLLTVRPYLIAQVMPDYPSQEYGGGFHPGIFKFAFSRQGRVFEVVVDDRLPSKEGRPLRCRSANGNEFWGSLLEKAYAKLHGSYQALQHGRVADAIASFAGGIPDHWDLSQLCAQVDIASAAVQERLARLLQCHVNRDGLLLFSLRPDGRSSLAGDSTRENLVYGRGYLLTDVQQVCLQDGASVWLLKLQTARYWDRREWLGPWRDGGDEWNQLAPESASRVNHWFKADCLFWISLPDALKRFTDLDMCLARTGIDSCGRRWTTITLEGRWSGNYAVTDQLAGPQFLLQVKGDGFQMVTFCLEQGGPETACRPDQQSDVGLELLRVEENRLCRLSDAGPPSCVVALVEPERRPVVTLGVTFAPGTYVLMPHAKGPADTFTLRAFSQLGFELRHLTDGNSEACSSYLNRRRKAVTRLVISRVSGLAEWLDRGAPELKVKLRVSCKHSDLTAWESRYYHTDASQSGAFETDLRLLIYRYRLGEPVRVEVFHSSVAAFTKSPVGWANLGESAGQEVSLIGSNDQPIGVRLHFSLCTSDDLQRF